MRDLGVGIGVALIRRLAAGRRGAGALLIVLLLLTVGCSSTGPAAPTRARMSAEEATADIGTVAVDAAGRAPAVSFGRPFPLRSRLGGAKEGALAGFLAPILIGFEAGGPGGAIYGFILSPITTIVGTIYGALALPSEAPTDVEQAPLTLETAAGELDVQLRLRDLVVAGLRRQYSGTAAPAAGGDAAPEGPDTVVEVWVSNISLLAGTKPTLYLNLSGGMQVRKRGRILEYTPLATTGREGHTLQVWTADDGQRFKDEITLELEKLAEQIVTELLSRPAGTPSAH